MCPSFFHQFVGVLWCAVVVCVVLLVGFLVCASVRFGGGWVRVVV